MSQDVLLQIFDRVDMVEPMAHFLDEAKQNPILKGLSTRIQSSRLNQCR